MSVLENVRRFLGELVHDIRADGSDRWRIVAVLAAIGAVSIAHGLVEFAGGWRAAGIVAILMALALCFALQGILVIAICDWFRQHDRTALRVYLLCVLISATLSMAFWYQFGLNQWHANGIYQRVLDQTLDNLRVFEITYGNIADTSLRLGAHSQEKSQAEAAVGGTCDVREPGAGVRTKFRAQDHAVLMDYANHFTVTRGTVEGLVRSAEGLLGASVDGKQIDRLREIIARMSALAADPRIGQLNSWLASRVTAGRNGVIRDGQFFRCRDVVIEQNASALSKIALAAPPMPQIPNPSAAGADITQSFGVTFRVLTLQWREVSVQQLISLLIGLVVDVAVYFVIRSIHLRRNPFDGIDLDGLTRGQPSPALALLLARAVRRNDSYSVFIAHRDEQLRRLLWALERVGMARYRGIRTQWWVPTRVRSQLGTDRIFELYTVPKRAFLVLAVDPYRIDPPASGNRGSGAQVDDREALPAGVTPIGGRGSRP